MATGTHIHTMHIYTHTQEYTHTYSIHIHMAYLHEDTYKAHKKTHGIQREKAQRHEHRSGRWGRRGRSMAAGVA